MFYLKKYAIPFLLLGLWLLVQFFLYQWHHIKIMNDSHRYLEYAQDVVYNGISWQPHNRWYLGFVMFLSIFVKLGIPLGGIIVTQALLSLLSITLLSYNVGRVYGRNVGYILAFLLIAWFKISEWNYYLLTESLYVSGVMLLMTLLLQPKQKLIVLYVLAVALFFLLRPTSILFIGSVVVAGLMYFKMNGHKTLVYALVGVGIVLSYFVLNKMLESFIIVEAMERREAIFAYSTNTNFPLYDWVVFDADKTLDYPNPDYSQVTKMILFVVYNPLFFIKLSLAKLFYFYANVKPYFSWQHNVVIVVFLWISYVFLVKGFKRLLIYHKVFLLSYLMLNGVMIILCSADWDGRFLIPVLPVIFVGSSLGVVNQLPFLSKHNSIPKDFV